MDTEIRDDLIKQVKMIGNQIENIVNTQGPSQDILNLVQAQSVSLFYWLRLKDL